MSQSRFREKSDDTLGGRGARVADSCPALRRGLGVAHEQIVDMENPHDGVRHRRRARIRWRRGHACDASPHDGQAWPLLGDGVADHATLGRQTFNRRILVVKKTPMSAKGVIAILPLELLERLGRRLATVHAPALMTTRVKGYGEYRIFLVLRRIPGTEFPHFVS